MKNAKLGWLLGSAAMLVSACDGDADSEDQGMLTMPPAQQVSELREALKPVADALCMQRFACCSEGELAFDLGASIPDAATCSAVLLDRAERAEWIYLSGTDAIQNVLRPIAFVGYGFGYDRVTVDEAAVQACAAELSAEACAPRAEGDFCVPRPVSTATACDPRKLFVGNLEEGALCNTNAGSVECGAGLRCASVNSPQGVCVPMRGEGSVCSYGSECGVGQVCDPQRGVCTAGIPAGQPCAYVDPEHPQPDTEVSACASGLSCDTATLVCTDRRCHAGMSCSESTRCPQGQSCIAGVCGPLAKRGEPCNQSSECEDDACVYYSDRFEQLCGGILTDGTPCQSAATCESGICRFGVEGSVCAPKAALGEPCNSSEECVDAICVYNPDTFEEVCTAGGGVGATCEGNYECQRHNGLSCVSGTCQKPPFAEGASCEQHDDCLSELCYGGICTAPATAGAACSTSGGETPPCAEGHYCVANSDLDPMGTCQAKRRHGEACTEDEQCWQSCDVVAGKLRCRGMGPTDAWCSGR